MSQCRCCGFTNNPGIFFCKKCDVKLGASYEAKYSNKNISSPEELADTEKELFKKIIDMSRELRKGRFNFSGLEDLIDLEEDVQETNNDLLLFRFSELINELFFDYVIPKSVQLFGYTKNELLDITRFKDATVQELDFNNLKLGKTIEKYEPLPTDPDFFKHL